MILISTHNSFHNLIHGLPEMEWARPEYKDLELYKTGVPESVKPGGTPSREFLTGKLASG